MESIITNNHFRNKKVLITGGGGFIGSHLVKRMLAEGAKVFVIERKDSNLWRIKKEEKELSIYSGDIRHATQVDKFIKGAQPDYVFHLAAYGVDSEQRQYITAAEVNIMGTLNILNSLKDIGCEKFINMGSCAEYGDYKEVMYEEMKPIPVSIYGSTKACSTILSHQIAYENNMSIVTLRPFGIFGEGEETHKIFCHIIMSIIENKEVKLTLCEQYRDYCYVENIVDGLMMAAVDKNIKNEIFNIGSGESYPLKHYVNLIFKNIDTKMKPIYGAIQYRKNEMWNPKPDINKIKKMLNWKPRISLEEGLVRTIHWFKKNKDIYLKN